MTTKWKFIDGQYVKVDPSVPREPRAPRAQAKPRESRRRRSPKPEVVKTCGNCKYIRYTGIKEVSLESCCCDNYALSGKCAVQNKCSACQHWRRRGNSKMSNEQHHAEAMRAAIDEMNAKIQHRRR